MSKYHAKDILFLVRDLLCGFVVSPYATSTYIKKFGRKIAVSPYAVRLYVDSSQQTVCRGKPCAEEYLFHMFKYTL